MGVIITPSLVIGPNLEQPLTHARIGIDTFATADNLVAASSDDGSPDNPPANAANPMTYEHWEQEAAHPSTGVLWYDRTLSPQTPTWDYVGIAGHNLGSTQCVVKVRSAGAIASPTVEAEFIPGDDDAIMVLLDPLAVRYGGLLLEPKAGADKPVISALYMGKTLAMTRPIYGGIEPITLARKTAIRPRYSETGQFLGRSIVRKGRSSAFPWKHLDPTWYRNSFDPFVRAARTTPWFIAWRPEGYPSEVAYCWTTGDVRPMNMGVSRFMEVTVPVEALDVA